MNVQTPNSVLVPTFRSITIINPDMISHIQAIQNYCRLYKDDGTHILASISFGKTIQLLEPYGFYRCHRSYALKLNKVVKYFKEGQVEIKGKIIIPVARRRRKQFLGIINIG